MSHAATVKMYEDKWFNSFSVLYFLVRLRDWHWWEAAISYHVLVLETPVTAAAVRHVEEEGLSQYQSYLHSSVMDPQILVNVLVYGVHLGTYNDNITKLYTFVLC
ncbi:unnamed protein product [Meganyctiphanes norvegica]|uniref:Uncharacterized protein n=1 Tax=Meganyctiphanes norvegica TaxID=48144 RepID=A0AAV2Q5C3_MEGNR